MDGLGPPRLRFGRKWVTRRRKMWGIWKSKPKFYQVPTNLQLFFTPGNVVKHFGNSMIFLDIFTNFPGISTNFLGGSRKFLGNSMKFIRFSLNFLDFLGFCPSVGFSLFFPPPPLSTVSVGTTSASRDAQRAGGVRVSFRHLENNHKFTCVRSHGSTR